MIGETKNMETLDAPLETRVHDIFLGIGFGISTLLIFVALWIPAVALLIKEYRWLIG